MVRGQERKGVFTVKQLRTWIAVGLVVVNGWAAKVSAEEPASLPNDEFVETTFDKPQAKIPKGTALTEEEQQALWGKGRLGHDKNISSQRPWPLFEGASEQYLDVELRFAPPEGSIVSLPPRTLVLATKANQITINDIALRTPKGTDASSSPSFYQVPLADGVQLLVVRAAADDYHTSLGALLCMNLVYEQLKGIDRLPGEEDQVPLVAQEAKFSLQSLAYGAYQSGVKPGVVSVQLVGVEGVPVSTVLVDQAVGFNPTARLVYEPTETPQPLPFGEASSVRAASSYRITAHAWSGDELTMTATDSLAIRRIAVDDRIRERLQKLLGRTRRLRGPVECLFVRWQHTDEVIRSVDKAGELHALVKRAGG